MYTHTHTHFYDANFIMLTALVIDQSSLKKISPASQITHESGLKPRIEFEMTQIQPTFGELLAKLYNETDTRSTPEFYW